MVETSTLIRCNHCGVETFHDRLMEKTVWGWFEKPAGDYVDHPDEADWNERYEILQCLGCGEVCVRVARSEYEMPPDCEPDIRFYPPRVFRPRPNWFSDLPSDLHGVLDEVYAALAAGSRRLAVMGVRTAVERMLSDKVGESGGFAARLENLEKLGLVGRADRERLEAVVDVGHAAAHRGHAPSPEDLEHVMDILENTLRSAYKLERAAGAIRKNTPRRYPRGV